jgi:predicted negative regulator of RcsB-dependent stress response
VEAYRTEEEQVEALRDWWKENGRSTIVAIILALGLGFGYQGWKDYNQGQAEGASQMYQRLLQVYSAPTLSEEQQQIAAQLGQQLKSDYAGSTYAQFAALHLARIAVTSNNLAEAEAELRWVLGKADAGSDIALVAQLRLARVLAARGESEQALAILDEVTEGPYRASYAVARGDILLGMARPEEASAAFQNALALASDEGLQIDLVSVQQKLQALNPRQPRATVAAPGANSEASDEASADTAELVDGAAGGEG